MMRAPVFTSLRFVLSALLTGGGYAYASPEPAPSGWNDATEGEARVVTNGTSRVEIGDWQDLNGQSLDAWLGSMEHKVPPGSKLLSSQGVQPERVKGAYSVGREIERDGKPRFSILYACPGLDGVGRLMTLDVPMFNVSELIAGATFGERVCENEAKQPVSQSKAEASESSRAASTPGDLAKANASIPAASRPKAAHIVLEQSWVGFPAVMVNEAMSEMTFPNGNKTTCLNWNPMSLLPTPGSIGKKIKRCEVTRGRSEGKAARAFTAGERLDVSFGNVSASGRDMGGSSSSSISGSTLRMTKSGRIQVGKFSAFDVASGGNGVGGGSRRRALSGRYYLNGYTITIETDEGEIVHGFIAKSSNTGSSKIDHIFVNGEHFWNRK